MLARDILKSYVGENIYKRGLALYEANGILGYRIHENPDHDEASYLVQGSGKKIYSVDLDIDKKNNEISGAHCDCPAFYNYDTICKHCVAAVLSYIDDMEYQQEQEEQEPQTTPALKKLLQVQTMKKALPFLEDETYGKIRLETALEYGYEGFSATFKIGCNHMYVLKDIFEFVHNIQNNANVSYGKKLQFVHTLEAFDKESIPFITFLCEWVKIHEEEYQDSVYRYGYGYDLVTKKIKKILLSNYEFEDFIGLLKSQKISISFPYGAANTYTLSEEDFKQKLYLEGLKHGLQLELEGIDCYSGKNYDFYFQHAKDFIYKVPKISHENIRKIVACLEDNEGKAYIQKEDIPAFCREILPSLEKYFDCIKDNFNAEDYGLPEVSFEIYLDSPEKDFITCKVLAVYDEIKYNVYEPIEEVGIRDIAEEAKVRQIISSYCNAFDESEYAMVLANDEEKLYKLLTDGVLAFQEVGELFISDSLRKINVSDTPKVAVGVSLSGNLLELQLTSGEMSRNQLIEVLSAYKKKKKFYRLKNGDFMNINDESMDVLLELKQGLAITDKQLKQEKIALPKYRALYLDAELKDKQGIPITKNKDFKALVRNMKTVEDNDFEVPEKLSSILREYQKTGFLWMKTLKNNGFGGILADDMGLGKTLQVITFLQSELEDPENQNKRCLIVSPASLVYNWQNELERFAPDLSVKVLAGNAKERKEMLEDLQENDVVLTSYDLLRRDIDLYENISFGYQVIDEAQYIKNHTTQAAHAVKTISADCKLALTGTPVENRLSELWSIFDYLMPGFLYSYKKFREEIELPVVQNAEKDVMERLHKMIRPFVLRRMKKEVLKDLPDKLEKNMYAKMEGEQQKLYDANVKRLQLLLDNQSEEEFKTGKIQILSELTKLRQICCDPALTYENYKGNSAKTDMCMDLILNAVESGHKILIFSQFTTMLTNLEKRLEAEGISYYTLTGSTSKIKRKEMVEKFNQDDTSVFCISLKAGGTGLNLTSADIVIHYDPWWNLAVQNQATDRAHRIGQKNLVTVYKLIVKGTIEENIVKLQEKKKALADEILNGDGMDSGSFTKEELLDLLTSRSS